MTDSAKQGRVLIVGATSAIAEAVARLYALKGCKLCLVGRRADALQGLAADLRVRGAVEVAVEILDATQFDAHADCLAASWSRWDGFDVALIAYGTMPEQSTCEADPATALRSFETNATSVVALLLALAARFEEQKGGTLAVISSPAGERGRAANYVYGAAKAAVTATCSGLRQRLFANNVRVLTILPGFVDTPMTAALPKGPLWATPTRVAKDIVRAIDKGAAVVYTPWFWRWIMVIVRTIPERIFVRLRF